MATTIDENFFSSLFSNIGSTSTTVLDELNNALRTSEDTIANAAQMLSEIHGPYNGVSNELYNVIKGKSERISNLSSNKSTVSSQNTEILNTNVNIKTVYNNIKSLFNSLKDGSKLLSDNKDTLLGYLDTLNTYTKEEKDLINDSTYTTAYSALEDLAADTSNDLSLAQNYVNSLITEIANWKTKIEKASNDSIVTIIKSDDGDFLFRIYKTMEALSELADASNLFSYLSKVADLETTYKDMESTASKGLDEITNLINDTSSLVNRINKTTGALFDTPLLREFVSYAQNLHPELSMLIQQNINKFPYFQQVSEAIGSFYTITSTINSIDPINWLKTGSQDFFTNNIIRGNMQSKLFAPITNTITQADNLLSSMFIRNSPMHHMGMVVQNYAKETSAIAHGFSGTMDVFHAQRANNAKAGILPKLLTKVQDRLRLLDTFFPVVQAVKTKNKYYKIPIEDTEMTVNSFGRPVSIRKSEPEKSMIAKESEYSGGRDNEN